MKKSKKCPVCKLLKTTCVVGTTAVGTLFTVYMLNLDQKLLAWSYARVNEIFDRKPVDIKF
jgi:hypothetical protein